MATISLTIVRSRPQKDGSYNVKLALAHGGKTTYISTPYNVDNASQWRNGRVVNRADAAHLNKRLRNILDDYQARIDALPNAALTIAQVRELVTHAPMHKPTIAQYCTQFQSSLIRQHRESYATNIGYTAKALAACFGDAAMFDTLTPSEVRNFETWLREHDQSDTTINIRMSHLKTLVNNAIMSGVVTYLQHPFNGYNPPRKAVRDIALTLDQLHTLRDWDAPTQATAVARDMVMLSFYLGGINFVDLLTIDFSQPVAVYKRSKTGNEVHITIPVDAQAIAAKYIARNGKLSLGYHFHRYEDLRSMLGRTLREIRKKLGIPQLCYYSARKTFVQFGYELGIPLYLLEYAVGQTVKDMQRRPIYNYFRIMQPQVDDAVAKIIAYSR